LYESPAPLESLGLDERRRAEFTSLGAPTCTLARVVRVDRGAALAHTDTGIRHVRLPLDGDVAVGDFVAVDGDLVRHVLERRTAVTRLVGHRRETLQVLAANVDAVLIARPLDLSASPMRIQSLVNLAYEAGAIPIVLLTKADVVDDPSDDVAAVLEVAPGVDVHLVSAVTGQGIDEVRAAVRGRTVVLVGESGAGKSTLINLLLGDERILTGATRRDGQGRHTTSSRELHPLPGGGAIVDTPGVREVVGALSADQIAEGFADVEAIAVACRFADCSHDAEPGCAVQGALRDGALSTARLEAYVAALRDAAWNERRASKRLQAEDRRSYRAMERQRRRDAR